MSTVDPHTLEADDGADDPRPVFQGDWASASGTEKGLHADQVRLWKERHGIAGGRGARASSGGAGSGTVALDAERESALATLDEVIASAKSLASDRIRAVEAKQRILARVEEEARAEAFGPLVALRHALDAVPEGERVSTLEGLLHLV